MKQPFRFGQVAWGDFFINREKEKLRLSRNFSAGVNTIVISPRRYGKSSLIRQIAKEYTEQNSQIRFCFLDLFNVQSENDFYRLYAKAVISSVSSKTEEAIQTVKDVFKTLIPQISLSADPVSEIELSFHTNELKRSPEEIINLAETVALKKGIKIVVCLDEFQNICHYENPLAFQKKLRANWQLHSHATYCLYGSRQSMMTELFTSRKMPFYHFGDLFYLERIEKEPLVHFVTDRFAKTGKSISPELAEKIVDNMERHPHYVQHLAHIVWQTAQEQATEEDVTASLDILIYSYVPLFQRVYEDLSRVQIAYLKALCDGITDHFSNREIIEQYQFGSSANLLKAVEALDKKEIIDKMVSRIEFLDPVFKVWFKRNIN
jgi:hypothetical protein